MDTITTQAKSSTHPLILVAAASVATLSLAGVGVLAGWLPGPSGHATEPTKPAAVATAPAPISVQQHVIVPASTAAAPKSVARSSERPAQRTRTASSEQNGRDSYPDYRSTPVNSSAPVIVAQAPQRAICQNCGVVEAVREVAVEPKGSGGGAVAGGIIGGILGNQVSKGATRDFATVLGAIGGAYAGNHIEKSVKEAKRYDTVVRFEDGSTRTFSSNTPSLWHSGDRVRLQNGELVGRGDLAGSV